MAKQKKNMRYPPLLNQESKFHGNNRFGSADVP